MDNNAINIIITIIVVVAFIFIYVVLFTSFFDNFSTAKYEKSIKIKKKYNVETLRLLKKICYQFRHRSFDAWLAWLRIQENDIQNIALNKLIQHLNGDLIEWDESVTPDIIMNLTVFKGIKNLSFIFPNLLTKIKEASHNELVNQFLYYKSSFIPFITLYPSLGLEYLEVEVEELINSEELGSTDKKKFIVEQLKRINTHFNEGRIYDQTLTTLLVDIICNNEEDSIVRWEAFEVLGEFDPNEIHQASLKILPVILEHCDEMDEVISQIFKSLIKDLVKDVNKPEIFSIFKESMNKPSLKPIIITTLGNLLMGINSLFNLEHLFAIYKLDEDQGKDLIKILAKRNTLTETEIEFIEEPQPKHVTYEDLISAKELSLDDLPVPSFQKDYIDGLLKKIGRTTFEKKEGLDNSYESAILRGPNKYDKAYICRLFCLLRNKTFKHINIEKIIADNKNDPGTALENQMKYEQERTMFYISNIERIYSSGIKDDNFDKHLKKIKQILKVYSSHKDYFLVSSSEDPLIMQEAGNNYIDIQADNIFKNIMDFNLPGQYDQLKLLENMVQKMNKKRIKDGEGIMNQLLAVAKDRSMIEGYYIAAKFVKLLLVLFTEYESIEPILNLEEKYEFLLNEATKKKSKNKVKS